jgi:hypothetical protein
MSATDTVEDADILADAYALAMLMPWCADVLAIAAAGVPALMSLIFLACLPLCPWYSWRACPYVLYIPGLPAVAGEFTVAGMAVASGVPILAGMVLLLASILVLKVMMAFLTLLK